MDDDKTPQYLHTEALKKISRERWATARDDAKIAHNYEGLTVGDMIEALQELNPKKVLHVYDKEGKLLKSTTLREGLHHSTKGKLLLTSE